MQPSQSGFVQLFATCDAALSFQRLAKSVPRKIGSESFLCKLNKNNHVKT